MVFTRFSTGCDRCRLQHTKCDEARPSCRRCLRRGIVCPGYRSVHGFVFKVQTGDVTRVRSSVRPPCVPKSQIESIRGLNYENVDRFIAFFFHTYVVSHSDVDPSYGLLLHVSDLCRRALPTSSLVQAANVLGATTFVLSRRLDGQDFAWYHETKLKAIRSLRHDVQDETSRLRDDTLMAVLLLDLTEAIVRGHMGTKTPFSHHNGVLELIKLRAGRNFQSSKSASLYHATRYATLRGGVRRVEGLPTTQPSSTSVGDSPALRLLNVLDKISALQCTIKLALTRNQTLKDLEDQFFQAHNALESWTSSLEPDWLPTIVVIQGSVDSPRQTMIERYQSMEIALLYNRWRCACLMLIRMRGLLDGDIMTGPPSLQDEGQHILDGVCRAVPIFLGWLQGSLYVEQDENSQAWKALTPDRKESEHGCQRFPGDWLGKWFLSELLDRVEQAIDGDDVFLPKLDVSAESLVFLQEQRRILSDLPYLPSKKQLQQLFPC